MSSTASLTQPTTTPSTTTSLPPTSSATISSSPTVSPAATSATAAPTGTAPANSTAPATVQGQVIALDINGIGKSQAGEIVVAHAGDRIIIQFNGMKHAMDADGAPLPPRGRASTLEIALNSTDPLINKRKEADVAAVLAVLQEGAERLKVSLGDRRAYQAAEGCFDRSIKALLSSRVGASMAPATLELLDPRGLVLWDKIKSKVHVQLDEDMTKFMQSNAHSVLMQTLTGAEKIYVKVSNPSKPGNADRMVFSSDINGVTMQLLKAGQPEESISARLDGIGAIPQSSLDWAHLTKDVSAALDAVMPRVELQPSPDLLGSTPAWNLINYGSLSHAKNLEIKGRGHVSEKLDVLGAKLEDVVVESGIFQLEGKLLPGSVIRVKKDATLMLDLEKGSDVTLIIEEGGKVMSGPKQLGIDGCTVKGEIHGDASQLHFGDANLATMSAKQMDKMIYDTSKMSARLVQHLTPVSTAFKDIAKLKQIDLSNLDMKGLGDLLNETKHHVEPAPDGFVVKGYSQPDHKGVYCYQRIEKGGETTIYVEPIVLVPGKNVSDLTDNDLNKLRNQQNQSRQEVPTFQRALAAILQYTDGGTIGAAVNNLPKPVIPSGLQQVIVS